MNQNKIKGHDMISYTFDYTQDLQSFQSLKKDILEKMSQHPNQEFYLVFNAPVDSAYRQHLETLARRHNEKVRGLENL